jgi:molybdopterin-containing oxidoreductase family iron-sulfur binding subunit
MTQRVEPKLYQIGIPKPAGAAAPSAHLPGPPLWRSLEELSGEERFQISLESEFPAPSEQGLDLTSRRDFLRMMGASLALSGLAGCAVQPLETIVPYVDQPEAIELGKPLYFATAVSTQGFATGVLVKSREGRPIKIEGNPTHPASGGATDALAQAEILALYDPDRSQVVLHQGRVSTWERFQSAAVDLRSQLLRSKGRGLRLLSQTITSPTLAHQLDRLLKQFPEARWHSYEPVCRDNPREAARQALGEPLEPIVQLDRADLIVSLESDFLAWGPDQLRHARQFASRRETIRAADGSEWAMNRLYVVESTPSLAGAAADHRLAVPSREILSIAMALGRALKIEGLRPADGASTLTHADWISAVARELDRHRGRSVVLAGEAQPAAVHVLAIAMNHALGNVGKTVSYHPPASHGPAQQMASLSELARDLRDGQVQTLLILGGNPVYEAPADLEFAAALKSGKVGLSIHLGLYDDETAELCHWHIPQAHFLEAWSDLRALDGTVTIQQPLIAPLYQGRSSHELLGALLAEAGRSTLDTVRDYWSRQPHPGDFESVWRKALIDGVMPGTATQAKTVTLRREAVEAIEHAAADQGAQELELVFRPDPTIWDGRHANNGWLQELPKPLTRLTWDNPALISPAQARKLGLASEDMVELRYRGRILRLPVWVMPGQAETSVTVHLGHGRSRAGRVGSGVGFNANLLRTSDAPWFSAGLEVVKTDSRHPLAAVQHHHAMEGRDLVRSATISEFQRDPEFARAPDREHSHGLSLYPEKPRGEHAENAWGMAIDLNRCIGCGACVVACQAENNIPVVGKEEVLRSREMHWLRIDRYYEGDESDPRTHFQPVPCMHCEKAPCELVCPVGATTHSDEGLNEMTYNRCVGTRYCSNNCPYKVRRFNFFQYADQSTESLKLQRNPEVTVRSRGVMEKCTYCVQRINHARIQAKIEDRAVGGDEVVTACQGVCPAQAIVFGNLADPRSAVAQAKSSPRNYALLAELNTLPRTTYLASLRNPNPDLETSSPKASDTTDGHPAS